MKKNAENYLVITGKNDTKNFLSSNRRTLKISTTNLIKIGARSQKPHLLGTFNRYDNNEINEDDVISITKTIGSYFMRRSIYGGLKTNGINILLIDLCSNSKFTLSQLYDTLINEKKASSFWPTDEQLLDNLDKYDEFVPKGRNKITTRVLSQIDSKLNKKTPFQHWREIRLSTFSLKHLLDPNGKIVRIMNIYSNMYIAHEISHCQTITKSTLENHLMKNARAILQMKIIR